MEKTSRTSPGQLTAKQEQAIAALLSCSTVRAAARKVGVAPRTLANWLDMPLFKERYEAERIAILSEVKNGLTALASKSLEAIEALLDDAETPAAVKLKAAITILEHVLPQNQVQEGRHSDDGQERDVVRYMTDDELEMIDTLTQRAELRKQSTIINN